MRELRWVAQHSDGSVLKEFELLRGKTQENSFYAIRKNELISFGLEGSGLKVGFLTADGIIGIHGAPLEVALARGYDVWPLTNRKDTTYNDIIQYKDAEFGMPTKAQYTRGLRAYNRVTQYNLGYKVKGQDEGLGQWHYQVIVHIPADEAKPLSCTFKLVVVNGFEGRFLIRWGSKKKAVDTIVRPNVANQLKMNFIK